MPTIRRVASVIHLRPEAEEEYLKLHRAVWPGVLAALNRAHITNYSIFLRDGTLYAYYEYTGDDYEADMAAIRDDPAMTAWCVLTEACQQPVDSAANGEGWADAEEVFHLD